jgi:outer membrane beta-barrel protein
MMTQEKNQGLWKKLFGATGLKVVLVLVAVFWLVIVAASWAESAELPSQTPTPQRAPATADTIQDENSEYNFNWLDPEKKIYVLQNRKYEKAGHAMATLMGGPGLSNSYSTAWNLDPRIAYYFSEAFGIEAFYTVTFNSQNNTFKALSQTSPTTLPVVRQFKNELGFVGQWVPWYAKINVFNKIIYFDWYFAGGAGQVDTQIDTRTNTNQPQQLQDQKFFALYAGTGHLYHLTTDVTVRLDFTGSYYRAPLQGNVGDSTWFSNYNFAIGFGYRL